MSRRGCIVVIGLTVMFNACTSGGSRHQPDEGVDDPGNTTERQDAASSAQTNAPAPDAGSARPDAAGVKGDADVWVDASQSDSSQSTQTSGHNPFHDMDARVNSEPVSDSGSLIIEPETEVYDIPTLCASIWRLQGQVIATNLLGHVVLGEWAEVQNAAPTLDGGVPTSELDFDASAASNSADAQPINTVPPGSTGIDQVLCPDKFAPYLVQCEQGVILLTSPTMVYGGGPILGGEHVSVGCWERECAIECVPTTIELLEGVHARVSPVISNTTSDGGQPEMSGMVRVNGVDVEALATLEITSRRQ